MALILNHQTAAEFAARFWRRVQTARAGGQEMWHQLIWWLIERINAGDITDAQARVTFNAAFNRSLTAVQWTALKTSKLVPIHDRWAALIAEPDL